MRHLKRTREQDELVYALIVSCTDGLSSHDASQSCRASIELDECNITDQIAAVAQDKEDNKDQEDCKPQVIIKTSSNGNNNNNNNNNVNTLSSDAAINGNGNVNGNGNGNGDTENIGSKSKLKKRDYEEVEDIGRGAYGFVKLVRCKDDETKKMILKHVTKSRILVDTWVRDRELGTIPSEIQIMHMLRSSPHPNIVEMVDFFEDDKFYYIAMPPFGRPGYDLFDYIEVHTTMTEDECKSIFYQVCLGIQHLHNLGIAHRDIKDENIVLNPDGHVKLIDLGSAAYLKDGPFDQFTGTLDYASPEVLAGQKYSGKEQDVWAAGILLYTLIYKENPFYNVEEIMDRDLRVSYIMSEENINLIRTILNRDLKARPTIDEILKHKWFDGVKKASI